VLANLDDVARGLEQLRALVKPVEELKRKGNPYREAERSKLEFQIKDALRDIFGEGSAEYQQNKNFRIKSTAKAEVAHAVEFLQSLIVYLEDKKLELEGKKPRATAPPVRPVAPPPVPPAAPPPPVAQAAAAPPPVAPVVPPPPIMPAPPPAVSQAAPHPSGRRLGLAARLHHRQSRCRRPAASVGNRFHAVARQLRLRHEGRPTPEVEDEYDAQDLVHAPLYLEFDEIRRETWQPGYAGGAAHTYFVVPRDRRIIEVKKTRPGVGAKEITSQVEQDTLFYWTHPDCQTLLCFVYNPEARVGDPYGLEKALTREMHGQRAEVFISPK
jgi:hypothetical protein